jgi:hypothetical protein
MILIDPDLKLGAKLASLTTDGFAWAVYEVDPLRVHSAVQHGSVTVSSREMPEHIFAIEARSENGHYVEFAGYCPPVGPDAWTTAAIWWFSSRERAQAMLYILQRRAVA